MAYDTLIHYVSYIFSRQVSKNTLRIWSARLCSVQSAD